jgi:hypothetical protein
MMGPGDRGYKKMMVHSGNLGGMGSGNPSYDPSFGSLMGAMNSLNVGSK